MTNEQFEQLAEQFYKETGFMAPGKDQPAELNGPSIGVRAAEWEKWMDDLTEGQKLRIKYAVEATYESLALCGIPPYKRGKELAAVRAELLVKMKVGKEQYPSSDTETVWGKRELSGWRML